MYKIGDKIVYPLHGAGVIKKIEEREVLGKCHQYYILQMPLGDMQVMVPIESTHEMGLRNVIDLDEARRIVDFFEFADIDMSTNWNKRYRENLIRIKSGDIEQTAIVVKGLMIRDKERGLSTGERKMLISAKNILFSELVLALGATKEEVELIIEQKIFLK